VVRGFFKHKADCGDSITATNPHLKTPMIQQWNITVERDLGHELVARVSYRGSMSTQLPVFYDLNLPQASTSDLTNVSRGVRLPRQWYTLMETRPSFQRTQLEFESTD